VTVGDHPDVRELIALAKREDLGAGDITTRLLENPREAASFRLQLKSPAVLAGREIASEVLTAYDPSLRIEWRPDAVDGRKIEAVPTDLAKLEGPLDAILAAERVLLNFLQRLCGVATLTRACVDAVAGTNATILDTRKTTPGWRVLEKYAVRCGGGTNHRMGLHDVVLIKDNHIVGPSRHRLAALVFEMLNRLPPSQPRPEVCVEARSPDEVEMLLGIVGVDVILLDNFSLTDIRRATRMLVQVGLQGKVALEVSGGVTLQTVRAIAETGVERISVGALTHSAPAVDLSLERD